MKRETAETLGLEALGWLAAHDELLPVFLGATGAGLSDMRERAQEPEFLGAVLDFLMMDDAWVEEFCAATGHPAEAPYEARQALPGGALPHWT